MKAFTLVELLAVIALLAIISIITVPSILNIYNTSKENAFKTSTEELINISETDFAQAQRLSDSTYTLSYDETKKENTLVNPEGKQLKFSGKIEKGSGNIIISKDDGRVKSIDIKNERFTSTIVNKKLKITKK